MYGSVPYGTAPYGSPPASSDLNFQAPVGDRDILLLNVAKALLLALIPFLWS